MKPVLYAEDDPNDVFFLQDAWAKAEMPNPLQVVRDGKHAIHYLAGDGKFADRTRFPFPCLLLLDLKLPVRSGFDVLRWLRQQPAIAHLRVVIFSGSEQDADLSLARRFGATDYIVKPGVPAKLAEILRAKKSIWLPASSQ